MKQNLRQLQHHFYFLDLSSLAFYNSFFNFLLLQNFTGETVLLKVWRRSQYDFFLFEVRACGGFGLWD